MLAGKLLRLTSDEGEAFAVSEVLNQKYNW